MSWKDYLDFPQDLSPLSEGLIMATSQLEAGEWTIFDVVNPEVVGYSDGELQLIRGGAETGLDIGIELGTAQLEGDTLVSYRGADRRIELRILS